MVDENAHGWRDTVMYGFTWSITEQNVIWVKEIDQLGI